MPISIGKMRHKMTIEEKIVTADGGGGFNTTWQAIASNPNIYVDILEINLNERAKFQQVLLKATHKIITRYHKDITLDKRLTNGTDNFAIEAIENIKAENKFLQCYIVKL